MKQNLLCQTPPTVTVRVKSSASRSHQQKTLIRLKWSSLKDHEEKREKKTSTHKDKCPKGPCLVIQRQEMTAFFKLFGRLLMTDTNVLTEQWETIKQVCFLNLVI